MKMPLILHGDLYSFLYDLILRKSDASKVLLPSETILFHFHPIPNKFDSFYLWYAVLMGDNPNNIIQRQQ